MFQGTWVFPVEAGQQILMFNYDLTWKSKVQQCNCKMQVTIAKIYLIGSNT